MDNVGPAVHLPACAKSEVGVALSYDNVCRLGSISLCWHCARMADIMKEPSLKLDLLALAVERIIPNTSCTGDASNPE
jgi:hypothetical protein